MDAVLVEKNLIPYQFDIRLGDRTYSLGINYNAEGDFFTVDLYCGEEVLAVGEKVVYGQPLWVAYADERFPGVAIVPLDMAEQETRVSYENLGKSVFMYVVTEEDLQDVEAVSP